MPGTFMYHRPSATNQRRAGLAVETPGRSPAERLICSALQSNKHEDAEDVGKPPFKGSATSGGGF